MKVLVCGDRNWTNEVIIEHRLRELPSGTTIIHGACRGADMIADTVAKRLGVKPIPFPVRPKQWEKYGRSAGPIRNRIMLLSKPDLVLAFHGNISNSKGTKDCVNEAKKRGIQVELIGNKCPNCGSDDIGESDDGLRLYCVTCGKWAGKVKELAYSQ